VNICNNYPVLPAGRWFFNGWIFKFFSKTLYINLSRVKRVALDLTCRYVIQKTFLRQILS
jgi:hypothetical protein